jgi:hypothetical protein
MNRYIVRATRLQTVEIMVTGWDEDDAFDNAMESTDWDVIETGEHEDVFVTDVTNDHNYLEEI